jgi:hypothetical protein
MIKIKFQSNVKNSNAIPSSQRGEEYHHSKNLYSSLDLTLEFDVEHIEEQLNTGVSVQQLI